MKSRTLISFCHRPGSKPSHAEGDPSGTLEGCNVAAIHYSFLLFCYAWATARPSSVAVYRAIMSSSLVGITHTETGLADAEIHGPLWPLASASRRTPNHSEDWQIRCLISGEFSPIPAVKTMPSTPPSTAASAPISFAAR